MLVRTIACASITFLIPILVFAQTPDATNKGMPAMRLNQRSGRFQVKRGGQDYTALWNSWSRLNEKRYPISDCAASCRNWLCPKHVLRARGNRSCQVARVRKRQITWPTVVQVI